MIWVRAFSNSAVHSYLGKCLQAVTKEYNFQSLDIHMVCKIHAIHTKLVFYVSQNQILLQANVFLWRDVSNQSGLMAVNYVVLWVLSKKTSITDTLACHLSLPANSTQKTIKNNTYCRIVKLQVMALHINNSPKNQKNLKSLL